MDVILILSGLALLVAGGEALVRGASGLALLARVTPAVVGLTVVAAGTSMPELVVSVQSSLGGSAGMAAGNVVGSNIFNVAAILGIVALVRPLRVQGNTVRFEWPVMLVATCAFLLLVRDGLLDRTEGALLLVSLIAFTAYVVVVARRAATDREREDFGELQTASLGRDGATAWCLNAGAIAGGAALLAGGSSLLVSGAVGLAASLGVADTLLGLTVVAAGTSTPELVTSLVAARRGRDDVAVANVVGSCVFNLLGIGGLTALLRPLPVPQEIVGRDNWWMLGLTVLLFPLMKSGLRIARTEGAVLLAAFVAYTALLLGSA